MLDRLSSGQVFPLATKTPGGGGGSEGNGSSYGNGVLRVPGEPPAQPSFVGGRR